MEATQPVYAGFWMRFLSYIIDAFLLGAVSMIIIIPIFGATMFMSTGSGMDSDMSSVAGASIVVAYFFVMLLILVLSWLYFALMESSAKGATLGKLALGLRVTDLNGNRVSFARASGRYFGKILSGIIFYIGFIMAAFTQQKQALHDMLSGCLVVKK